jgi:cytochrome c oxidase subunit 2
MDNMDIQNLMDRGSFILPEAGSSIASSMDFLFYVIFWGSLILFAIMCGIGVYFLVKYKRSASNQTASKQVVHNDALEIGWTVIPLIIVMIIFAWGYRDYLKLVIPPVDAKEIRVVGKKWLWEVEYPREGIKLLNEIVVPVGQPIKLLMTSTDVLHSFYLPNFRIKKDILPNRYTRIWFYPEKIGNYHIFCTEYCGDGHSGMGGVLRVLSQADYDEWLVKGTSTDDIPLLELGQKIYKTKNCNTCHSVDGTQMVGPSWKGLYGSKRQFTDGSGGSVDENYISESILIPGAKVVSGYASVMPSYSGLISEREISGIIEYIKTLK